MPKAAGRHMKIWERSFHSQLWFSHPNCSTKSGGTFSDYSTQGEFSKIEKTSIHILAMYVLQHTVSLYAGIPVHNNEHKRQKICKKIIACFTTFKSMKSLICLVCSIYLLVKVGNFWYVGLGT